MALGERPTRGLRTTHAQPAVISGSVALPDLQRVLLLRRLLMERQTMFARSGLAESDLLRKWSALQASALDLRIVSVTPLDAQRLPTFN